MIAALVAHLVADFFLQNDWMSSNKSNPAHPAGYVHAFIHAVALLCIGLSFEAAFVIGAIHWIIDLRTPLLWWGRLVRQSEPSAHPGYVAFAMLRDQAAHVIVIFAVLRLLS